MAHELEFVNGEAAMAYAGDVPWHGLGVRVPSDLTPHQMLQAAKLDWTVRKVPAYVQINDENVTIDRQALVRSSDDSILDIVSDDWHPVQNEQAFDFFNDFIAAGDMEMHTAGSLKNGQIVWALAKVKDSFTINGHDQVDSYLLFSNFHKYGFSTDVRFTPVRVVCNNTLTLSLDKKSNNMMKFTHRTQFNPEVVKEAMGFAKDKLQVYEAQAKFLSSKMIYGEDIITYFKRVFPVQTHKDTTDKEVSRNAELALANLHTQPGAEFAEGSYWQAFNAATYIIDHKLGRNQDSRIASAWYGPNKNVKDRALNIALEMAL